MTQSQLEAYLQSLVFRQNTVRDLLEAVIIFAATMAALWIVKVWLIRLFRSAAKRTVTQLDDFLIDVFAKLVMPVLYAGSICLALASLDLPEPLDRAVGGVFKAVIVLQAVRGLLAVLGLLMSRSSIGKEASNGTASRSIMTIARILVWVVASLFLLDNLGFDVNAVIAGLGIGGIAVALAAQTILGDLFNYFVIIFDQPFVEGDFIVVDEFKGEIEKIGIKSTRIRSLDGDMLIVSNSNLMSSRIRNFKRMAKRRAVFTFGVVYQTPAEKVQRIPDMVRQIILKNPKAVLDRAHFKAFGESSLDFEVVYHVLDREYGTYMDIQQEINLEIMRRFAEEGIDFAYPTQTVYEYKMELPKSS